MIDYCGVTKENGKVYGHHIGCGCCGGPEVFTKERVQEFIDALEEELEKAKSILKEME